MICNVASTAIGFTANSKYTQSNLLSEIKKITQCMFSINLAQNVYLQFWVFFSVTNTMPLPLWHLPCIDLDHAWNSRHESVSWSVHSWEISKFLCRGLQAPKNCAWKWYFGWVFVTSVQLKWYNFRRQESFWGLVDIQGRAFCMQVLMGVVWALWPQIKAFCHILS